MSFSSLLETPAKNVALLILPLSKWLCIFNVTCSLKLFSLICCCFQVSEVNPRANFRYHIDVERPPDMRSYASQRVSNYHTLLFCELSIFLNEILCYWLELLGRASVYMLVTLSRWLKPSGSQSLAFENEKNVDLNKTQHSVIFVHYWLYVLMTEALYKMSSVLSMHKENNNCYMFVHCADHPTSPTQSIVR